MVNCFLLPVADNAGMARWSSPVFLQGSARSVTFLVDDFVSDHRLFFGVVAAKRALVAATIHTAHAGLDAFILGLIYLFFLILVVCTRQAASARFPSLDAGASAMQRVCAAACYLQFRIIAGASRRRVCCFMACSWRYPRKSM